ncbi:MFS transporter [Streptomyces boninensis]|uniref:MFS transporter n=1 Tax=Streptomyces boninensis TaxID=2039455 RepID=UPI003B21FA35
MPRGPQVGPGQGRIPVPDTDDGRPRWALVAVAGALSFIAMLDMNIVNVALADIAAGFEVAPATAQWAVLGYQLPVVALLLPAGRWLDSVGYGGMRPALLAATGGFALCSLLAALAPWVAWLVVARIAQGAFGAVLFVLMPVLVIRSVPPEMRGRAMSVPATLGPLGAVTGPAVGGVLLDAFGWHAVFLVKLPFCLAAMAVAYRCLPLAGRLRTPDRRHVADAALAGTALTALLLALTLAPDTPVWLLLGLAALPPLWWWLRGPGGRQVTGVLRAAGTYGVHAAVLALAAAFAAMQYTVALRLQQGDGFSATATGLTVLAFPLAMGLAGPLGGRLADRWGARPTAIVGAAMTAAGLGLLVPFGDGWGAYDVAWRLAVAGGGMGLYGGPTQSLVMGAAPPEAAATAGSAVQSARSLGFALGPAVAAATWGLAAYGTGGGSGEGAAEGAGDGTGARWALALAALAAALAVGLLARHRPPVRTSPGATVAAAPAAEG